MASISGEPGHYKPASENVYSFHPILGFTAATDDSDGSGNNRNSEACANRLHFCS